MHLVKSYGQGIFRKFWIGLAKIDNVNVVDKIQSINLSSLFYFEHSSNSYSQKINWQWMSRINEDFELNALVCKYESTYS